MSDELYTQDFHPSGAESRRLLRETDELFRWRIGPDGRPERRPANVLDYTAQSQHNARTSWGWLPTQIMMAVGNELAPVDRRHFLGTANMFKQHGDYIDGSGSIPESEAWFYTKRILRDAYHHAVELENAGMAFQDAVACAGCEETHSAPNFTQDELRKPPFVRQCRGRTGRFKVCEHVSLQWDSLAVRCMLNFARQECIHPDHLRDAPPWALAKYVPRSNLYATGQQHVDLIQKELVFYRRIALRKDGQRSRTYDEWENLLEEKDCWICPHLRLVDILGPLVEMNKREGNLPADYVGRPPDDMRLEAGRLGTVRSRCTQCSTNMRLIEQRTGNKTGLPAYVQIERELDVPSRPNDEVWVSHLEF